MPLVLLSYVLSEDTPLYPGEPPISIKSRSSLQRGDACNTFDIHMTNHAGTHVDGPAHFNPDGPGLWQLPIEAFVYERPLLIVLPKGPDELIVPDELAKAVPAGQQPDILLIKTGFSAYRASDAELYRQRSPGLSATAAAWLVENLRSLKAIALDTISAGAPAHPDEGHAAHRILCGADAERFVLIYEDVNLQPIGSSPRRVWAFPLLAKPLDSAPVTIVAEI